ncbi:MAG: PSD1 domain-containing protein [Planctomycetia bacterium]|nr:PSD1 domain-containing protein [Planctomycetia bacterium]
MALATCGSVHAQEPAPKVEFNRDVRPILSENCFQCHGPDAKVRQAELRLDQKEGLFKEVEGGQTIVAGEPEESVLFKRITSSDADEHMPPADSGRKLSAKQIETIRQWIAQGAVWQGHWAYLPPVRPAVPEVPAGAMGGLRSEIDRFIAARLIEKGLAGGSAGGLSPTADPVTLVRRLHFDLTGLPPKPEVVEQFARERSDRAYEELVDGLLASPHYGERMAIYWLDLVRYADTTGIHGDNHRDVDLYRDWVIDAFNHNLPFDRFTVEQLAGDLLPGRTKPQLVASGYNRMLMTTQEGGAQPKEYLAKYFADRVRNASSVWLGATMGCCECHDHKFDPYSTKDFYSFGAFFADLKEIAVGAQEQTPIPTEEQEARMGEFDKTIAALKQRLATTTPELAEAQAAWEKVTLSALEENRLGWTAVKPEAAESNGGQTLTVQDDASVLAGGEKPAQDVYTVALKTSMARVTGLKLEALRHESLAGGGLSRANGNFVLTGVEIEVAGEKPRAVKIASAAADYAQKGFPIEQAIDDKKETGWAVDGQAKKEDRKAAFVFAEPVTGDEGLVLTVRLKHESPYAGHNIGRFRLSLTAAEKPALDDAGLPPNVAEALKIAPENRGAEQKELLAAHYRSVAPALAPVRAELAEVEKQKETLRKSLRTTLVSTSVEPRTIRILRRGNWLDDSGEVVGPAVPHFLPQLTAKERPTRLDLAQWMVSKENPLVARVYVNRLWKLFFGEGIVRSLDDFGSQGSWPTHGDLLDYLAVEFVESGWDTKAMVRRIVMSAAYRQTSHADEKLRQADPYNLYLARQGRFRLDAEMVRDQALFASGLLVPTIGGPSVKPYQPRGYWSHLNFPVREWEHDAGEKQYRRGLYTYWCRTFLHPSLLAFDASTREECTVARPRSNTPLQALALLNDPTYVEAARALAERALREGGETPDERVTFLIRQVLSRSPRPEELKVVADLQARHLAQYQGDKSAAEQVLSVGQKAKAEDLDAAELAAWTSAARVVLNLHEGIVRY